MNKEEKASIKDSIKKADGDLFIASCIENIRRYNKAKNKKGSSIMKCILKGVL